MTKKIFFLIFLVFITFSHIFSASFTFDLKEPTVTSIRDSSIGGFHIADKTSYFSFISNPANTSLIGKKKLLPSVTMNFNGVLNQLPKLLFPSDEGDDFLDKLLSTISEEEVNIGADILGPITVGSVKNNFGWGVFNRTYALAEVPSITSSNIYAGEELQIRLGYSYPIKLPLGIIISLGLGAKGFMQLEGIYKDSITELLAVDFENFPMYTVLGYGFDLGLTAEVFKIFRVSACWENFFSQAFVKKYNSFSDFKSFDTDYDLLIENFDNKIKIGLAVDIPLKSLTKGFITDSSIYLDCKDLFAFINEEPLSRNKILELSAGAELIIFNTLAFRFGVNETYLSAGFGMILSKVRIDYAIYGKELGLEPGSAPQLNMGLSISIQI